MGCSRGRQKSDDGAQMTEFGRERQRAKGMGHRVEDRGKKEEVR